MRDFNTGATRDVEIGKLDFEGFLSPEVLVEFAKYMDAKRLTAYGVRDSDNWQLGIPREVYFKSLIRHVMDLWIYERTGKKPTRHETGAEVTLHDILGGIMFNIQGYWFEALHDEDAYLDPEIAKRRSHELAEAQNSTTRVVPTNAHRRTATAP